MSEYDAPSPKPGDKIIIKINGKEIETVIDDEGVQRLPCNNALMWLCHGRFNDFWEAVENEEFTRDEVKEIYQNIGYSLCGYEEVFEEDVIENPLWGER